RSRVPRWRIVWQPRALTIGGPPTQTRAACPRARRWLPGSAAAPPGGFPKARPPPPPPPTAPRGCPRRPALPPPLSARPTSQQAFDFAGRWFENRMAREGSTGPYRGFERMELAMHAPLGGWHYSLWLQQNHPSELGGFARVLSAAPGGDTGAPEVSYNPIPRE